MYCIKCGVELADTEKVCPLCQTTVYHPQIQQPETPPLFPPDRYPPAPPLPKGSNIVITVLFLLPLALVLLADFQSGNSLSWAGYVIGALLLGYVCVVLPLWFRNPNPVIFVPCGFAAGCLYLLYINWSTGGDWFLTFALPVLGCIGLIVTTVVTLVRYVKRGKLYIAGGAMMGFGALVLMSEILMNYTFKLPKFIGWSLYPLITLVLLGGLLLFLAICHSARKLMERKFFI